MDIQIINSKLPICGIFLIQKLNMINIIKKTISTYFSYNH